jgi:hypothetical protein
LRDNSLEIVDLFLSIDLGVKIGFLMIIPIYAKVSLNKKTSKSVSVAAYLGCNALVVNHSF